MKKVFIDCPELIPCNPCESACSFGAIIIGKNIIDLPQVDLLKCTGCGKCVAACPGQACFVVDEDYQDDLATIDFPYEYLPEPVVGLQVYARDNEGRDICKGEVIKVIKNKNNQQTTIIRLAVPKKNVYQVRGIGIIEEG
ncbi:MAG: 4Fe-4S dicluster domain-containing protein [Clostridia bacterium]